MNEQRIGRRHAALVIASAIFHGALQAQDFPSRPLRILVPATAGGPSDVLARVLAQALGPELGQPIVVENLPGGGGSVAQVRLANAPADGQTLFLGNVGQLAANPVFVGKQPYDAARDFRAVASVANAAQVISARADLPVRSFDEFAAYLKTHQASMNWGTGGIGSGAHLGGLLLEAATGAKVNTIHYPGSAQAIADVMAGRIDYMVESITTAAASAATGKVKPIVVLGEARSPVMPDVPAIAESRSDLRYHIWNMLVVRRATPDAVVDKLNAAVNRILRQPEVVDRYAKLGLVQPAAAERTSAGATALINSELVRWRRLLTEAGIKPGAS